MKPLAFRVQEFLGWMETSTDYSEWDEEVKNIVRDKLIESMTEGASLIDFRINIEFQAYSIQHALLFLRFLNEMMQQTVQVVDKVQLISNDKVIDETVRHDA